MPPNKVSSSVGYNVNLHIMLLFYVDGYKSICYHTIIKKISP